jgi:hypothetical protein
MRLKSSLAILALALMLSTSPTSVNAQSQGATEIVQACQDPIFRDYIALAFGWRLETAGACIGVFQSQGYNVVIAFCRFRQNFGYPTLGQCVAAFAGSNSGPPASGPANSVTSQSGAVASGSAGANASK